jgi:hypothetical protein
MLVPNVLQQHLTGPPLQMLAQAGKTLDHVIHEAPQSSTPQEPARHVASTSTSVRTISTPANFLHKPVRHLPPIYLGCVCLSLASPRELYTHVGHQGPQTAHWRHSSTPCRACKKGPCSIEITNFTSLAMVCAFAGQLTKYMLYWPARAGSHKTDRQSRQVTPADDGCSIPAHRPLQHAQRDATTIQLEHHPLLLSTLQVTGHAIKFQALAPADPFCPTHPHRAQASHAHKQCIQARPLKTQELAGRSRTAAATWSAVLHNRHHHGGVSRRSCGRPVCGKGH